MPNIPELVQIRDHWVPDASATICANSEDPDNDVTTNSDISSMNKKNQQKQKKRCTNKFYLFWRRKHHCCSCGKIFCGDCAPVLIPPLRFCDDCCTNHTSNCFGIILEYHPADSAMWGIIASKMKAGQVVVVRQLLTSEETERFHKRMGGGENNCNKTALMSGIEEELMTFGMLAALSIVIDVNFCVISRKYDKVQCFARAIELDPSVRYWSDMAREMTSSETVKLQVRDDVIVRFNKFDCYKNALFGTPNSAVTWCNLAIDLNPVDIIRIENPDPSLDADFNKEKCFLKSLELNPKYASAWSNLGFYLAASKKTCELESAHLKNENTVSYRDCFIRAIELQPKYAIAWSNLASALDKEGDTVSILLPGLLTASYQSYTKKVCAIRAVELDESRALSWFNLACTLKPKSSDVVEIHTGHDRKLEVLDRESLFKRILDNNLQLTSIKMRTQLGIIYRDHPRILELNKQFSFEKTKYHELGRGKEGRVYRGRYTKPNGMAIAVAVKETDLRMSDEKNVDFTEVQVLVEEKFTSIIVECYHVTFSQMEKTSSSKQHKMKNNNTNNTTALLWMELAQGSLADIKMGKLLKNSNGTFSRVEIDEENEDDDDDDDNFRPKLRPLDSDEIRPYAFEILKHLMLLHYHHFTHGDLKPQNVLLFGDGTLKLADFGLSKFMKSAGSDDEEIRAGQGTPGFMPPKEGLPKTAFDIWGFGATLVDLISPSMIELDPKTLLPIIPEKGVSPTLREMLMDCFEIEPAQRITAEELYAKYRSSYFQGKGSGDGS